MSKSRRNFLIRTLSVTAGVALTDLVFTDRGRTQDTASLLAQVQALPQDSNSDRIKQALLLWALNDAQALQDNCDSTNATALLEDVTNALPQPLTIPQQFPSNIFPPIPQFAQNPYAKGAIARLTKLVTTEAVNPYPPFTIYSSAINAGTAATDAQELLRAFCYPDSPLYLDARLVAPILNRVEAVLATAQPGNISLGDFAVVSELAALYYMLTTAFPALVLPSRGTAWLTLFTSSTEYVVQANGKHLSAGVADLTNLLTNADVKLLIAIAYGSMILNRPQYDSVIKGGFELMQAALYPDGATAYYGDQNEAFSYHSIYVTELARYWQFTGDQLSYDLVAGTKWYLPLSLTPPGLAEWYTAPSWHFYWNQGTDSDAAAIVTGLTGSPENAAITQRLPIPASLFLASFYRPDVQPKPLPDSWITYDRNIQGPRAQFGKFIFAATGRATPLSKRGKATFVGCMVLEDNPSPTSTWPLDAALNIASNQVLLVRDAEQDGVSANLVALAQNEQNATTTTSKFGALTTRHNLSGYQRPATSWVGLQTWLLTPTRLTGLVQIQNTAQEKAVELNGALKLISGRATWGKQKTFSQIDSTTYQYGALIVQIYEHDYADIITEFTNTYNDTANKAGWIKLRDALDQQDGLKTFAPGTSHFYLVEIRPQFSDPAVSLASLDLSSGLVGFQLQESSGDNYSIIHNPTDGAISYSITDSTAQVYSSGLQYRPSWLPQESKWEKNNNFEGYIPPFSHIIIHNS